MYRQNFNAGWRYTDSDTIQSRFHGGGSSLKEVTLPFDAMIRKERIHTDNTSNSGGYFPGGTYVYYKDFIVSRQDAEQNLYLELEGAYANTMVFLNDCFLGKCPHGYSGFLLSLDRFLKYGESNTLKVVSRSSFDSRWYSGGGIYRDVHLIKGNLLHITPYGLKISTPDIDSRLAIVQTDISIENNHAQARQFIVHTTLTDPEGRLAAEDFLPITVFRGEQEHVRQRLEVASPVLWSTDNPSLYTCRTGLYEKDQLIDQAVSDFGIRSLSLDSRQGLQINHCEVKLRGACVHHDNGVIGANTFAAAEERRVRILKEAGFNAVRSSHNPLSRPFLNACDRLGMLVIDEAFDMWNSEKTDYDYSLSFQEYAETDLERMVDKDFNHPSVIIYSIGNEIVETGNAAGASISRRLADKLRSLDSTRFVTNAVNGIYAARSIMAKMAKETGGDINDIMNQLKEKGQDFTRQPIVAKCAEESYATVDIAGYNYLSERYLIDHELYPNRIILGTENTPADLAFTWPLVKKHPFLLGNFVWTGWDYLGEAGIGRTDYNMESPRSNRGIYPWYIAYCGDIDITGYRRPASYFHEIIWGLRKDPYMAVQDPAHFGKPKIQTMWTWTDYISSWSWHGLEGMETTVEVYSDADETALFLNGSLVGRQPAGPDNGYIASFTVRYQPGILEAVSYSGGIETGRCTLISAGSDVELQVCCSKDTLLKGGGDLVFLEIQLTDKNGILQNAITEIITVSVKGAGTLLGYGSADPKAVDNFFDTTHSTFNGRLLAVIRSGMDAGEIRVTLTSKTGLKKEILLQTI
ncbi:MAG: DUF4982 domain-containing protein [Acetatifactor sp.]|nr:DUF4982 domain-containing protein [Acetatifactor sp.]